MQRVVRMDGVTGGAARCLTLVFANRLGRSVIYNAEHASASQRGGAANTPLQSSSALTAGSISFNVSADGGPLRQRLLRQPTPLQEPCVLLTCTRTS